MSEKVVITKEQAEALKELAADGWSYKEILESHINLEKEGRLWTRYAGINGLNFDTLVKALYMEYEVKKSPEEMVLELYKYEDDSCNREATCAIRSTLDLLGIKIEGVNK